MRRALGVVLLLLFCFTAQAAPPDPQPKDVARSLDRAQRLLRHDRPEEAALALAPLVHEGRALDREREARLLLGKALIQLGLPHLALLELEPLALDRSSGEIGEEALTLLLDQALLLDDKMLVREVAERVPLERWPVQHWELLHLARGYSLMQQGEWTLAQLHFEAVETPGLLRAQADFFTAIVVARKDRLMAAVRFFRQVDLGSRGLDLSASAQEELQQLKDLALLNIGHIYYGLGNHVAASGYYGDIGEGSIAREEGRLGLAWTRFMVYDMAGARRAIKAVRAVPAEHQGVAQAEVDLLEALVSFQSCDGEASRAGLQAFERRWGPQHRALVEILRLDALQAWEVFFPQRGLLPLDGPLRQEALLDADIRRVDLNLKALDQEQARSLALSRRWQLSQGLWVQENLHSERIRYEQVGGDLLRSALRRESERLQDMGREATWTLLSTGDDLWEERCAGATPRPPLSTLLDPP